LPCLPVLGSMLKLALDIWAGGGDMNFDKEPNGAILSYEEYKTSSSNPNWEKWTMKLFIKDISIIWLTFFHLKGCIPLIRA